MGGAASDWEHQLEIGEPAELTQEFLYDQVRCTHSNIGLLFFYFFAVKSVVGKAGGKGGGEAQER